MPFGGASRVSCFPICGHSLFMSSMPSHSSYSLLAVAAGRAGRSRSRGSTVGCMACHSAAGWRVASNCHPCRQGREEPNKAPFCLPAPTC